MHLYHCEQFICKGALHSAYSIIADWEPLDIQTIDWRKNLRLKSPHFINYQVNRNWLQLLGSHKGGEPHLRTTPILIFFFDLLCTIKDKRNEILQINRSRLHQIGNSLFETFLLSN